MMRAGVRLSYGCDCPASDFNPFTQIYRGAARVMDDGEPGGGFLPDEKVTVGEAMRLYTYNGAFAARMENRIGTLERGKLADFIALDQDILGVPLEQMRRTRVVMTVVGGEIVHSL
jgi:predicted amidohydrolase YtcJ